MEWLCSITAPPAPYCHIIHLPLLLAVAPAPRLFALVYIPPHLEVSSTTTAWWWFSTLATPGTTSIVNAQVGSLRMVLSLEELGPAVQQMPHQGPLDTATAAVAAALQPTASLGTAAQPVALQSEASSAGELPTAANPVSPAQHAPGSTMAGKLTRCCVVNPCGVTASPGAARCQLYTGHESAHVASSQSLDLRM